jgi:hypothetical protein
VRRTRPATHSHANQPTNRPTIAGAYYYEQCEFDDQRQRPRTLQTGMGVLAQLRAHADEELLALVNGILRELSQAGFIGRAQPRKLL